MRTEPEPIVVRQLPAARRAGVGRRLRTGAAPPHFPDGCHSPDGGAGRISGRPGSSPVLTGRTRGGGRCFGEIDGDPGRVQSDFRCGKLAVDPGVSVPALELPPDRLAGRFRFQDEIAALSREEPDEELVIFAVESDAEAVVMAPEGRQGLVNLRDREALPQIGWSPHGNGFREDPVEAPDSVAGALCRWLGRIGLHEGSRRPGTRGILAGWSRARVQPAGVSAWPPVRPG